MGADTLLTLCVTFTVMLVLPASGSAPYQPNWESLDSRPLPTWYDQAKLGIFIHWGVFSVPSFGASNAKESAFLWNYLAQGNTEALEFMKKNYRPGFTYPDFAEQFTAEFYDPNQWADMLEASGANYVVLVSKHHEGFCNWPTKNSWNWNSMDVGPRRDLVGDLAAAIRTKKDLHFGLYHSLFEWFNPAYVQDKANGYKTQKFVQDKTMPELYELVKNYKPDIVWSDGQWEASSNYWNSTNFLAWLYNESPVKDTVVTNDRWGSETMCKHGGYYTCSDKYNPKKLQNHKWENCMTLDLTSWGYRRQSAIEDYISIDDLITTFVETVSCGGNLLMNVGPTHDGRIVPVFEERLRQMGSWLNVNGEAIYSTVPWTYQNDTLTKNVWYTSIKTTAVPAVYAIALDWPGTSLVLGAPNPIASATVTMLGVPHPLSWKKHSPGGIIIEVPTLSPATMPCQWAWVFKITSVM